MPGVGLAGSSAASSASPRPRMELQVLFLKVEGDNVEASKE